MNPFGRKKREQEDREWRQRRARSSEFPSRITETPVADEAVRWLYVDRFFEVDGAS